MKYTTTFLKLFFVCCILLLSGISGSLKAQVTNGGFNQNTPAISSCSSVWAWTVSPTLPVQWESRWNNSNWWVDVTGCGWGNGHWLEQKVPTTAGQTYLLEFDLGCWNGQYYTDAGVQVNIDGASVGRFAHTDFSASPPNPLAWKRFSYCFTATSSSTLIRFTGDGLPTSSSPPGTTTANVGVIGLDSVTLTQVAADIDLVLTEKCAPTTISYSPALPGTPTWYKDGSLYNTGSTSITASSAGHYTLVLVTACGTFTKDIDIKDCDDACKPKIERKIACPNDVSQFYISFPDDQCAKCMKTVDIDYGDGNSASLAGPLPGYAFNHVYTSPGTYTVKICWYNACKNVYSCETITVVVKNCDPCKPTIDTKIRCAKDKSEFFVTFPNDKCAECIDKVWIEYGDGFNDSQAGPSLSYAFSHVYGAPGTYTVTICWSNKCTGVITCETITVVVKDCDPCKPIIDKKINCAKDKSEFYISFPTEECAACIKEVTIDFGDGNFSSLPGPSGSYVFTHVYAPGTYNVTVCWYNGCTGATNCETFTITVKDCDPCTPVIQTKINCANLPSGFSIDFPTDECKECIKEVKIDFGDGTGSSLSGPLGSYVFVHTYTTPGIYNVTICWYNGCTGATNCQTITIVVEDCNPCKPKIGTKIGCAKDKTQFDIFFPEGRCNECIKKVNIDYGDGSGATLPGPQPSYSFTHVYATPGTYTVTICWYNGCTGITTCETVTIVIPDCEDPCKPRIIKKVNCAYQVSGYEVTFPNDACNECIKKVGIDFGDGNSASLAGPMPAYMFTHVYTAPGTYTVTICWYDACKNVTTCESFNVVVDDCEPCKPSFKTKINCAGEQSDFYVIFPEGECNECIKDVKVDFGDGSSASLPGPQPYYLFSHVYTSPGVYTVTFCWYNACTGVQICESMTVIVKECDPCKPEITTNMGCAGQTSKVSVYFPDPHCAECVQKLWVDFGDGYVGTSGPMPGGTYSFTHVYAAPGTYTVTVCWLDICKNLLITCVSTTVVVEDCNPCKPIIDTKIACPNETSSFYVTFPDKRCAECMKEVWIDYGDGYSDNLPGPMGTYAFNHVYTAPGIYNVTICWYNACEGITNCQTITVVVKDCDPCKPTIDKKIRCAGQGSDFRVSFDDDRCAECLDKVWIDYGDGFSDGLPGPGSTYTFGHVYSTPGTYTVTVCWANGCTGVVTCESFTIVVEDCDPCKPTIDTKIGCARENSDFYVSFPDARCAECIKKVSIDFGDGFGMSLPGPMGTYVFSHVYGAPGVYNVTVCWYNACLNTTNCETFTITVKECDPCTPTIQTRIACAGEESTLYLMMPNADCAQCVTKAWIDYGDGFNESQSGPQAAYVFNHVYTSPGVYNVTFCWYNVCRDETFCQTITIVVKDCNPCPPIIDTKIRCAKDKSEFYVTFPDPKCAECIKEVKVDYGDGYSDVLPGPMGTYAFSHVYAAPGTYNVTICWYNACTGITNCQTITIVVEDCDPCKPTIRTKIGCAKEKSEFNIVFPRGECRECIKKVGIDYGDGSNASLPGPAASYTFSHVYSTPGTYNVTICWYNACTDMTTCETITIVVEDCDPCKPTITKAIACAGKKSQYRIQFPDDCNKCIKKVAIDYGDGFNAALPGPAATYVFTHVYAAPGTYNVTVCWTDGCTGAVNCETFTIVVVRCGTTPDDPTNPGFDGGGSRMDANGIAQPELVLFPNPTEGDFVIKGIPMENTSVIVTVYDLNGKLLINERVLNGDTSVSINAAELTPGAYIVRVTGDTVTKEFKLFKQ